MKKKTILRIAMTSFVILSMGLMVSCGYKDADAAQTADETDTGVVDFNVDNPVTADTVAGSNTDLFNIDSTADKTSVDDASIDKALSDDDSLTTSNQASTGASEEEADAQTASPFDAEADVEVRGNEQPDSGLSDGIDKIKETDEAPLTVKVENPGWSYYFDGENLQAAPPPFSLELALEERNEIIDEEQWFQKHLLSRPRFPYDDEDYLYITSGDNGYYTYLLEVMDRSTNKTVTLDFSDFRYADEYVEKDYDFICQRILYAQAKDGILYVATGHNTYAASSPQTAYITAIDLTDYHVIWKTEPLTCNAYSFALIDDYIVCGYGFTAEDDALKIVDMGTGQVVEEIPIKSMAYYIIRVEDKLYVRTYNTNYEFGIVAKK